MAPHTRFLTVPNALYAGMEETSKVLPASSRRQIRSSHRDDGKGMPREISKAARTGDQPPSTTSSNFALPRSTRQASGNTRWNQNQSQPTRSTGRSTLQNSLAQRL